MTPTRRRLASNFSHSSLARATVVRGLHSRCNRSRRSRAGARSLGTCKSRSETCEHTISLTNGLPPRPSRTLQRCRSTHRLSPESISSSYFTTMTEDETRPDMTRNTPFGRGTASLRRINARRVPDCDLARINTRTRVFCWRNIDFAIERRRRPRACDAGLFRPSSCRSHAIGACIIATDRELVCFGVWSKTDQSRSAAVVGSSLIARPASRISHAVGGSVITQPPGACPVPRPVAVSHRAANAPDRPKPADSRTELPQLRDPAQILVEPLRASRHASRSVSAVRATLASYFD